MAITYTVEQCETALTEIETAIDAILAAPMSASVGRDSFDNRGRLEALRARQATWTARLAGARNSGIIRHGRTL